MNIYILSNSNGEVLSVHRSYDCAETAALVLAGLEGKDLDMSNTKIYRDRGEVRFCMGYRGENGEFMVERHMLGK